MRGTGEFPTLAVRHDDGTLGNDIRDVLYAFQPDPDEVAAYEDAMDRERDWRLDR